MTLTTEQIKNLLVFLGRTQLSGNEAEILVRIKMILLKEMEKLTTPVKEEVKPPKEK